MYVQTFVAKISIEIKVRGKGKMLTIQLWNFRFFERKKNTVKFIFSLQVSDRTKIATNPRVVMKQIEDTTRLIKIKN